VASGSAARRYAQAVFDLAQEQNRFDEWYDELSRIAEVVAQPEMKRFLLNARISRSEKRKVANDTILGLSPQAQNLIGLLIQRDRLIDAPRIFAAYEELLFEHKGIARARVTTAVPLDPSEERVVSEQLQRLTGKDIRLTTDVDPSIIGGVVVRVGDRLLDGSTRTLLSELRERLAGQPA
jgi:F-type H+-transporting ATPase subunit delta